MFTINYFQRAWLFTGTGFTKGKLRGWTAPHSSRNVQSFTYEFKVTNPGTFMYHSHVRMQRGRGLIGAFIVRNRSSNAYDGELILPLQDWNHDVDPELGAYKFVFGDYTNRINVSHTNSVTGSRYELPRLHSLLIDGRGRFHDPKTGRNNGAPLSVFTVKPNGLFLFRVIGMNSVFPIRLSIDNHVLAVMATDGIEIEPVAAESIIVSSGERVDFILRTNNTVANYWIRVQSLESGVNQRHGEAIFRYVGAPDVEPTTSRPHCTADRKCVVVNCPFPSQPTMTCITYNEMKSSAASRDTMGTAALLATDVKEVFLNFAFPREWTYNLPPPGSVNGRVFIAPQVSALTQPRQVGPPCNGCRMCSCSQSMTYNNGDVIQMIIMNVGQGAGWDHPIHLHGHAFYVLKIDYGDFNSTSGRLNSLIKNKDIDCNNAEDQELSYCDESTFSNKSWYGSNIPGLNLENPILKDTIMIPTGSYAVIRFKSDNPGVWLMHCHTDTHVSFGMAVMLNVSFIDHPQAPRGFPTCHGYPHDDDTELHQSGRFIFIKSEYAY